MKALTCFAAFFSLIDSLATIYWVQNGYAVEANPIMEPILTFSPYLFFFLKNGLVLLGLWFLYLRREHITAKIYIILAFLVYSGIICYHLYGLSLIL